MLVQFSISRYLNNFPDVSFLFPQQVSCYEFTQIAGMFVDKTLKIARKQTINLKLFRSHVYQHSIHRHTNEVSSIKSFKSALVQLPVWSFPLQVPMMHGATPATVSAATTSATSVPFATATANQVCSSPAFFHSLSPLLSPLTFSPLIVRFQCEWNEKCMSGAQGSPLVFASYF